MSITVRYSPRAAKAVAYLKRGGNDIDVYVEDTANPNMWVKILKRYLPAGVKLSSVISLAGRKNVIDACRLDQIDTKRKRLYIIDSDMDIIHGKAKPQLKHLYRLRRYCIENYLVDQDCIVDALTILLPKVGEQTIRTAFDVDSWVAENSRPLRELFVAYAVSQYLGLGLTTVNFSCYKLFRDDKSHNFCPDKVKARVFSIYRSALTAIPIVRLRALRTKFVELINGVSEKIFCSAKAYIIPSIYEQVRRLFGGSFSIEVFKTALASNANIAIDGYLRRRLATILD